MKKVLVTGGAGYIGSHTVDLLIRRGYDPIVVDNLSKGHRHNVDAKRLHVMDVTDTLALARLMESAAVTSVIHFAAFIAVGESTSEPERYFSNNVGCALSLAAAMRRAGVSRLVFSSTAAVYGTPERVPITEDAPFGPVSPYGESKVIVEKILRWLDECSGLRSIVLRYFNACGSEPSAGLGEEHDPETHLIPLLLRAVTTGEPITLFGSDYDTPDGTCIRDYIHVSDLAEAHILALEALTAGAGSGAFNVGTGEGHTVMEVLRAVEEVTGRKVPYRMGPRRAGDAPALVADASKLESSLKWQPRFKDLKQIVATAWDFERSRS